jgi:hypothetical protein
VAPFWLDVLACLSLATALACATAIVFDIVVRGHRQRMWIMELVWPTTALYAGPLGWWAYRRYGRLGSPAYEAEARVESDYGEAVSTAIGVSHCGAGCTLGDIIGELLIFAVGLEIAGGALWGQYIADYALAFALGIAFQYFSIAPMRGLGLADGIVAALKADALSLTFFEIGLFGWMALAYFVLFPAPAHLQPDSPAYWLLMQVGMLLGFATAYPVNAWLIRRHIKEAM